jgi:tetratricopeptide (TPR) repeat protein
LNHRISLVIALCGASFSAALAQNGTENYYFPPKIATFGKSALPVTGHGNVIVKVLVNANGTFAVQNVLRSSDPADNAVALDIAKHSTYHPATKGTAKTPVTAFYDFTIDFKGGSAANSEADSGDAAPLAAYEAQIRAGKYADAETGLTSYLQGHPGDEKATIDLADTQLFQNDYTGAAATFDKLPSVPDAQKIVAAKAYAEASTAAYKAKQPDLAVADAKKAVALSPTAFSYNDLGMAEDVAGDHDAAVADLEKARDEAATLKPTDRVAIDVNLASILYNAGKDDQAKPIVAEITSLDPTNAALANISANHFIKLAEAADAAKNLDEGETQWVAAAKAAPKESATFYAHAALDEMSKKPSSAEKAQSLANMALAVDPDNALANYVIGFELADAGKKQEALAALNKADATAKSGPDSSLKTAIENLVKQLNNQQQN